MLAYAYISLSFVEHGQGSWAHDVGDVCVCDVFKCGGAVEGWGVIRCNKAER